MRIGCDPGTPLRMARAGYDPYADRLLRMWIGYEDADSLLTYPRVNNLSASLLPIRVASVSSVHMLIRLRELVLWIGSRPAWFVLALAAAAAPWRPGAVVVPRLRGICTT